MGGKVRVVEKYAMCKLSWYVDATREGFYDMD
jgi:hypothetical protein